MKKIGFDIHGVIDKNPELFSKIINRLKGLGYEIHIITGSLITEELLTELSLYNINYDQIFSILGFHQDKETEIWEDANGNLWIDDDIWNESKGNYCNRNDFVFHLDDTKVYGNYFDIPFGHITPIKENPRILEVKGDVSDDILAIFKEFEGYYKIKFI